MSSNSQVITGSWVKYRPSGYDYSLVKMHRLKLQFWFSSPASPKKETIQHFLPSLIKLIFFQLLLLFTHTHTQNKKIKTGLC